MHNNFFKERFKESIECKKRFLSENLHQLTALAKTICQHLKQDKKILLFGNGGSASDAQHVAAEFINRLGNQYRPAIPAIALTTDTSILTSISNDSHFDQVFARQIEALGKENDIAIGISTSGNSPNIVQALITAKKMNLLTVGLLGCDGGKAKSIVDHSLIVPSFSAQRIQETHIVIGHTLCEWVEKNLYPTTISNG